MEDEKKESGKRQLIVILFLVVFIQILFINIFYFRGGDDKMLIRIVRLVIIGGLSLSTFKKNNTAKWLLVAYLIFNGLYGLYMLESITNYILVVFSVTYLMISLVILFSKNINYYFSSRPK